MTIELNKMIELEELTTKEGVYDTPLYDKFTEAYRISDYEVLSDNGWINIEGVGKTIEYNVHKLTTSSGKELLCADEHLFIKCFNVDFDEKTLDTNEIFLKDLEIGDLIMTKDGPEMVMSIEDLEYKSMMYDLQVDRESQQLYYTNDILSHNSLWMQNFAVQSANRGKNVLFITLEMSEKKCLKRMGAMRLKVPIDKYDELSKDVDYIKGRIDKLHSSSGNSLFNEQKLGKILTKFYAAGTATVEDFDALIQNYKEKRDIDIDMIVVDYITLIAPVKGLGIENNLYMKGKHLAEGLRALGAKYNCPLITGIQVAKDAWNASDVTLDKIPESKAIAETADTFFAIIRTEEMKRNNVYRLKLLKQRDGDFSRSQVKFDLNPTYLTIENDVFIDNIL